MNSSPTNGLIVRKPAIFASYRIGDYPQAGLRNYPWQFTGTEALLLNAYDLISNQKTKKYRHDLSELSCDLHTYVEFDGPIILDSGAYNFLQHEQITISPTDVLNIGLKYGADISVVLDHPFPPHATPKEKSTRWANTLKNTQIMMEAKRALADSAPHHQIMPVLHGHDVESLKRGIDDLVALLGESPKIVGIGSLAPLARNGSKRIVVDAIVTVRELLPNAHVHCFSLGSALLMLLAVLCGADSVDSQTWIMSAAFKDVQLPGSYMTRLSRRTAQQDKKKHSEVVSKFVRRMLNLRETEGFFVRDWESGEMLRLDCEQDGLNYVEYLMDQEGNNNIHRRACHNLHVYNFEMRRVRQELRAHKLEQFIDNRVQNTIYKRVFEYASECRG